MHQDDLPKFAKVLACIAQDFEKSLSEELVEFYWEMLSPFDFAEVMKGISRHCANPSTGKYFPRPADIIAAITGDLQTQALLAWTKTIGAVQRVGAYDSVAFDDALIHAVVEDMGGWQKLCVTKIDQLPFVAKEFQERYRGYVAHRPTRYPKYLVGITESQNGLCGYCRCPLVLVGDEATAKQVIAYGGGQALLIHDYSIKSIKQIGESALNNASMNERKLQKIRIYP